jgi:hypothetical protein
MGLLVVARGQNTLWDAGLYYSGMDFDPAPPLKHHNATNTIYTILIVKWDYFVHFSCAEIAYETNWPPPKTIL